MTTLQLRHAAENGNAWAIDVLIKRLQKKQQRFVHKQTRLRKKGQGRVIPYKGRDAFFACARAF